ncbi:MAG: hypothetical protein IJM09_06850 [Neisseriaceae bacterium]|nr:hypothetical protein [Neisseriaceae bacterium]
MNKIGHYKPFRQPEKIIEALSKNIVGSQQKQARQRAEDSINNTARRSNAAWFCCESTILCQAGCHALHCKVRNTQYRLR